MKLNKQQKTALSFQFTRIMQECGITKEILSYLISRFNYEDNRRDWSSTYKNWKFQPCISHGDILWFTLTNPENFQYNFSLVGKPHYGDKYLLLGEDN